MSTAEDAERNLKILDLKKKLEDYGNIKIGD